jgi:hypothetical protein
VGKSKANDMVYAMSGPSAQMDGKPGAETCTLVMVLRISGECGATYYLCEAASAPMMPQRFSPFGS